MVAPKTEEALANATAHADLSLVLGEVAGFVVTATVPATACSRDMAEPAKWTIRVSKQGTPPSMFEVVSEAAPSLCRVEVKRLEIGDFDFDGHPDFAVPHDDTGPYGSGTFKVFVFHPSNGTFQPSPGLSALTQEYIGMFEVDPSRKVLMASSKSGCCIHWESKFAVVNSVPKLLETTRESLSPMHDEVHGKDPDPEKCEMVIEVERPGRPTKTTRRPCTPDER